ncbi:MAG: DNA internalization-related competence protein ComEC/Rec2 [Legionellales bacterium RIFCSPHIGHO2_12_FULL_42_9]|nr:MAG: DNA internalization-related competence protein ComEC/Rec2 [Legionellales bacterium RIFCSPHIGHO2_12_FULL_42_9]
MEILSFSLGVVFYYTHSIYTCGAIGLACILKTSKFVVVCFISGYLWACIHNLIIMDKSMPTDMVIANAIVIGEITSAPIINDTKVQFKFALHKLNNHPAQALILLSCYANCPVFKIGQNWQFKVKLKQPINFANPGGFDYVRYLAVQHIHWVGYIIPRSAIYLSNAAHEYWVQEKREQLAKSIADVMGDSTVIGVVQALALGVANNLSYAQWELFRRTGTIHLMVISGAHIALVAGFAFTLAEWLWKRSAVLCLLLPARRIASQLAIIVALVYSLLTGFGVPSERALISSALLLMSNLGNRFFTGWQAWRHALGLIVLFEPHAVLLPGFYLSFIAVAILLAMSQRFACRGINNIILMQSGCIVGLMPLTLYWYSYGAINGFIANLVADPLVGYLIVPLALLGVLIIQFFPNPEILYPVKFLSICLIKYLTWIDGSSGLNLQYSLSSIFAVLSVLISLILLIFFPVRTIWPAIIIIVVSIFCTNDSKIPYGTARIDVLDVGQGLAVAIATADHNAIYDTGVKFYKGSDMGKLVIEPYLHYMNIRSIDKLIISHPDIDHRGGMNSIQKNTPIAELIVNDVNFYGQGNPCHTYPTWKWDGVLFEFMHIKENFTQDNNTSCVLKISTSGGSILLTGDIERAAETYLIEHYPTQLHSNVLLIPHHGSKTSSSYEFIQKIAPETAIISAGLLNRYHFPHMQTLTTLKKFNTQVFQTIDCGMVRVSLPRQTADVSVNCYKEG